MEVESKLVVKPIPLMDEWGVFRTNVEDVNGSIRPEVCISTFDVEADAIAFCDELTKCDETKDEIVKDVSPIEILKSLQRGIVPSAKNITKSMFVVNRGMSQSWENLDLACMIDILGDSIPPENVLMAYAASSKKPSQFITWFKENKEQEEAVKQMMAEYACSRRVAELYIATTTV